MKKLMVRSFLSLLLAGSSGTAEQVVPDGGLYGKLYDYEVDTEAPIESEVFTPPLTFINEFGTITLYGQVNLAYQSFDDGDTTTDGFVDNANWNTRLGFLYYKELGDITVRARFESALGLRSSAAVSQAFTPSWVDWQRTALRWFELAVDSPYGRVSAGQGSSATDGTTGLDDSFTVHAGATDSTDGFASFRFRDAGGNLTDVTVGQVNDAFDGARRYRIRYDTPAYRGVTLASSYGINVLTEGDDNHYYDVAIRWLGDFGDVSVRSAVGYQWVDNPDGANSERVAGSVSALHTPSGLNLAFSAGRLVDGASYYWLRAGWRWDFFEAGTTSLSVDYYNGSDFLSDGAKTENYGLYAVQTIDAASLDIYAGWRALTYSDRLGNSYQDAAGFLMGFRFAF
jgi:hypothetical protein